MTPIKVSIVAKSPITPTTTVFRFKTEPGAFRFEPGQWVDLWVPDLERPGGFTFVSSPLELIESGTFDLAVKWSHNPVVQWLHETARIDDIVHIAHNGDFVMRDAQAPMVFLAGGVGVNPFRAMIATLSGASHQPPVWLFYAAKSASELAFHQDFHDWHAQPWFHYHPTVTGEDEAWPGARGRFDAAHIAATVGEALYDADIYLCGPDTMIRDQVNQLRAKDVQPEHLVYELWS